MMRCSNCGKPTKVYYEMKVTKIEEKKKAGIRKLWDKFSEYSFPERDYMVEKNLYFRKLCDDCIPKEIITMECFKNIFEKKE